MSLGLSLDLRIEVGSRLDKSLIVPQINHINEFIRPQLVPNSLNKEEFGKYVNFIIFPNFALKS